MFDAEYAIWYWAAFILGALALGLFIYFLIGDRKRAQRRCPKCWYDLRDIPGLRCPECGKAARHEKKLHRTRRRKWLLAPVFVLTVASVWVGLQPKIREDGWVSIAPNTVLILARRFSDNRDVYDELIDRLEMQTFVMGMVTDLNANALWDWQWRMLASQYEQDALRDDASEGTRRHALTALITIGREAELDSAMRSAQAVASTLCEHPDIEIQKLGFALAVEIAEPTEAMRLARVGISHEHDRIRSISIVGLGLRTKDIPEAATLIVELLQHDDADIRMDAMSGVYIGRKRNGVPQVILTAVEPLTIDPNVAVRIMATQIHIERMNSREERIEYILSLVQDEDWRTRWAGLRAAAETFEAIDVRLVGPLIRLLDDENENVSIDVNRVLDSIDIELLRPHREILERHREHPDNFVSRDIKRILNLMDGIEPDPDDPFGLFGDEDE